MEIGLLKLICFDLKWLFIFLFVFVILFVCYLIFQKKMIKLVIYLDDIIVFFKIL